METYLSYKERLEISKRKRAEQIRKRVIMVCIVVMVFVTTVLTITQSAAADTPSNRKKTCTSIEIQPGDTLWSIAKNEANENSYYADKDLRYIIKDLKKINNLDNSDLSIGQKLLIPNN